MSKRFDEALKVVDKKKVYDLKEGLKAVKKASSAKFDESLELAINLNLGKEGIRGSVLLPNGTGKTSKILVLAKGDAAKAATKAGADFVGDKDMIEKISKENWFGFDIIIATPEMMPELGRIGKILGPKGLMPNPKTGTVTNDTAKAVDEIKKGKAIYKSDNTGNINCAFGKVSFTEKKLSENAEVIMNAINKAKPSDVKGIFIKNISISSTMGPGIKISMKSFDI